MRLRWGISAAVLVSLLFGLMLARTACAREATPGAIVGNPDNFDGQTVTIRGTVTNLRTTVSRKGNPYYTYDLRQGDHAVRVFSFGKPTCLEGSPATVEGRFTKTKRISGRTFYNEVEANTTRCN